MCSAVLSRLGRETSLGAQGLVHITELSWQKVTMPEKVVALNEAVRCQILSMDPRKGRINLSIKVPTSTPGPSCTCACCLCIPPHYRLPYLVFRDPTTCSGVQRCDPRPSTAGSRLVMLGPTTSLSQSRHTSRVTGWLQRPHLTAHA